MTTRHFPTRRQVLLGAVAGVAGIMGRRSNRNVGFQTGSDPNYGAFWRFEDPSQVPPSGQYRVIIVGDTFGLQRARVANFPEGYGNHEEFFSYDRTQPALTLKSEWTEEGGATAAIAWLNAIASSVDATQISAGASAAPRPGFQVHNGDGTTGYLERMRLATGASVVILHLSNLKLNFGTNYPTQTTVGAAGAASALPANPTGYLRIQVAGAERVIPFYAQA